ncbi:hypothetical protein DPMN_003756 [Dreissena polymorpha]|uniref:Uncharacterized protein n=1 Tax=Dreissena polymorpha TaxID=45954 RepID=A0A9D4MQA4_DREPO|nr:hypothetical protein DPMN_003756 [Dreissena polymorpha]
MSSSSGKRDSHYPGAVTGASAGIDSWGSGSGTGGSGGVMIPEMQRRLETVTGWTHEELLTS